MLQIFVREDSPCPKMKYIKIHRSRINIPQDSTSRRCRIFEEGEFKVPIDVCINTQNVREFDPEGNRPRNFPHDRKGLISTAPIPGVMFYEYRQHASPNWFEMPTKWNCKQTSFISNQAWNLWIDWMTSDWLTVYYSVNNLLWFKSFDVIFHLKGVLHP